MNKSIHIFILVFSFWISAFAQLPKTYRFNSIPITPLPLSNTINDILVRHDSVWLGTDNGLSLTVNGGISWTNFSNTGTFDNKGISAIAIHEDIIWVATLSYTKLDNELIQVGGGLHYSTDHGTIWHFIPQPVDHGTVDTLFYGSNRIRAMDVTVLQLNTTFDIAVTKNTVWTANWYGMLRKSTDLGGTWARVILPPDSLDSIKPSDSLNFAFDLSPSSGLLGLTANNNHLVFSVYASNDSTIWVGTAGGINKSTDGGISWQKFSHQNHAISGNWVLALNEQHLGNQRIMWAATEKTGEDEEKGVSYSKDGGKTWMTTLLGERAYNITFKDSIVYVATDNGLLRSSDFGKSWIRSGTIYDPTNLQRFVSSACNCVSVKGDTVWFGGLEGIAYTIDSPLQPFGSEWHIFRTAEQAGTKKFTYAFPNPFSPSNEPVRLHYSVSIDQSGTQGVSIRIFDYAMFPVRTLIQNASRLNGKEYDEIWDGKNDNHTMVVNGVYFYRVEIGNQSPIWGKILVLR